MPDLHETINQFLEGSIASIGRDPVIESKTITENGTYTPESGVDGFAPVVVNVPPTEPVIESKNISENGTYTAPEGVDGYSPVVVNVPSDEPVIESKTITENGTYTPESGVDGFAPVVVNVPLPQNAYLLKSVNTPTPIASFSDGQDMVMPSLKVAIEPQQEGSGDPSPTNIRPISGWSNCVISVANAITDPTVEHTYTIDLDGTRYGGTLDVVSGVLTVDKIMFSLNGSENWATDIVGNNKRRFTCISLIDLGATTTTTFGAISNIYVNTKSSIYTNLSEVFILRYLSQYKQNRIDIMTEAYQDVASFKAFLNNTNMQICYELATPLTIQLSPTAVKSLLGSNNVWADTGDITDAEYFSKEE